MPSSTPRPLPPHDGDNTARIPQPPLLDPTPLVHPEAFPTTRTFLRFHLAQDPGSCSTSRTTLHPSQAHGSAARGPRVFEPPTRSTPSPAPRCNVGQHLQRVWLLQSRRTRPVSGGVSWQLRKPSGIAACAPLHP